MKNLSLAILIMAAFIAAMQSCAKKETENTNRLEELAFDAWMKKHVNSNDENIVAVKQANGIYVEVFEEGDQEIEASMDTIVWLRLDYTGTDLNNNVFVTRNEGEALRQATFTPHTHYIADYIFCGDENHNMIEGQYFAMKNKITTLDGEIKLSQGTKVKLYIPSYLAFGTSGYTDDQGYGGQYTLAGTKPVIETLEVVEVVKDPIAREEKLVVDHAASWGLGETDTLTAFFYVDSLNFTPSAELLENYPNKPRITGDNGKYSDSYALTVDSTANIWFVGRFLDGFIFDTNIESVYNEFYNRKAFNGYKANEKTLSVLSYTPKNDKGKRISAFYTTIPKLRRGQWYRFVFTSVYGYGATGQSSALQDQQDYYDYYMQYMYNSMYYNNYGGGYGGYGDYGYGSYYDNYYNSGYNNYYNYPTSSSEEEDVAIVTEIQPYTPLVFEIYIDPEDE